MYVTFLFFVSPLNLLRATHVPMAFAHLGRPGQPTHGTLVGQCLLHGRTQKFSAMLHKKCAKCSALPELNRRRWVVPKCRSLSLCLLLGSLWLVEHSFVVCGLIGWVVLILLPSGFMLLCVLR